MRQSSTAAGAATVALGAAGVARGGGANERVNLGWVGVGGRGTGLLKTMVEHSKDARIAAVCDLKPVRVIAGQREAERDKPVGYEDFRKMMDKEKLDGIIVATEVANHAKVVVPVLEAGINCFSEKPMDCTVEKVDRITRAARKAKCLYQIGTQRRYHPGFLSGMQVIHSGKLGKVTFMQGHWHWPWNVGDGGGWVGDVEMSGGELVEQACHHMDVMSWVMNNQAPIKCVSIGYQQVVHPRGPKLQSEDHSATVFQFADGTIFSYTHLFRLPQFFTDEKLWAFCEKAGIDLTSGMQYGRQGVMKDRTKIAPSSLPLWNERTRQEMVQAAGQLAEGDEKAQQAFLDKVTQASSNKDWGMGTAEELVDFAANIKAGAQRVPNANVETGRIATLMSLVGRQAMYDRSTSSYDPRVIRWEDLGSTTDPTA
jgi:predicted dehydrogenase